MDVEFVGARKRILPKKFAQNQMVENGTLEDDQNRRDFTINALALRIKFNTIIGELVDPFNGIEDFKK